MLLDLVLENRSMLQLILKKINAIDSSEMANPPKEEKLKNKFPLKTIDSLLALEEDLSQDDDFAEQLVSFFI